MALALSDLEQIVRNYAASNYVEITPGAWNEIQSLLSRAIGTIAASYRGRVEADVDAEAIKSMDRFCDFLGQASRRNRTRFDIGMVDQILSEICPMWPFC